MDMVKTVVKTFCCAILLLAWSVRAEPAAGGGTLVLLPAYGEVTQLNDRAQATLAIEEQDRDKAAAAARVNQKMARGIDIVKRADPQASLKTQGYYTYPVYADERPGLDKAGARAPQPVGWRAGQYLLVTTSNLSGLPTMIAAAQSVLTLNGLQFDLSPAAMRQLDARRIAAAYQNLNERIAAVAAAMGRKPSEALLESVDFEAAGAMPQEHAGASAMRAMKGEAAPLPEPSFEPGETTLPLRLVARIRFK